MNNLIPSTLVRARIPSTLESSGLFHSNSKCPDDHTLVPWSIDKSIIWDVTIADTPAAFYIHTITKTASGAAELIMTSTVITLETLSPHGTKQLLSFENCVATLPSPLKIPTKWLSYSNAYPFLSNNSMPFAFVTASLFKSTLTRFFLHTRPILYIYCRSNNNYYNNSMLFSLTFKFLRVYGFVLFFSPKTYAMVLVVVI